MTVAFMAAGSISIMLVLLAGLIRVRERAYMKRISDSENASHPEGVRKDHHA